MTFKKLVISYLIIATISSAATAGTAASGTITSTVSFPTGPFIFYQNGARTSPPACATIPTRWAIDVSTATGQAAEANILTAFATGQPIFVYGTGTCSVDGSSETALYVTVNP